MCALWNFCKPWSFSGQPARPEGQPTRTNGQQSLRATRAMDKNHYNTTSPIEAAAMLPPTKMHLKQGKGTAETLMSLDDWFSCAAPFTHKEPIQFFSSI